jgi:MATE family multidrug resistance protein
VRALLVVGRDLVARTGLLLVFLLLATRAATQIGPLEGAAQQAVRQVWMLAAFLLDAFAASAQSLIGFFLGAGDRALARRVARVACAWGLGAGIGITVLFALAESRTAWLLVPVEAREAFAAVWFVAIVAQPLNALAFVTDGIHWGTGDYRYLRNVMVLASGGGAVALAMLDRNEAGAFVWIWIVTGGWIGVRAVFGLLRVWPGIGGAPLRKTG